MSIDTREQVDAELLEVAELIPDLWQEYPPEEFWREIGHRIEAFRLYHPTHGDYARECIEGYLAACGLKRPTGT